MELRVLEYGVRMEIGVLAVVFLARMDDRRSWPTNNC